MTENIVLKPPGWRCFKAGIRKGLHIRTSIKGAVFYLTKHSMVKCAFNLIITLFTFFILFFFLISCSGTDAQKESEVVENTHTDDDSNEFNQVIAGDPIFIHFKGDDCRGGFINGDIYFEIVTGGFLGNSDIHVDSDDTKYIVSNKGPALVVYRELEWNQWSVDCIDRFAGRIVSRMSESGNLHIVYEDTQSSAIKYATNQSGRWIIETVLSDDLYMKTIEVDDNDFVHLVYQRWDGIYRDTTIHYGNNIQGKWIFETVTVPVHGSHFLYPYPELAVTGDGIAHIFYTSEYYLQHANNEEGDWIFQDIYFTGGNPVAFVEEDGLIHLLFSKSYFYIYWEDFFYFQIPVLGYFSFIQYSTGYPGTMNSPFFDLDEYDNTYNPAFKIDQNGHVHFMYLNLRDPHEQKYVTNKNGTWETTYLDEFHSNDSLAVDSQGNALTSFSWENPPSLLLATDEGGTWKYYSIDHTEYDLGGNFAMMNTDNELHVGFFDRYTNQLMLAANTNERWQFDEIGIDGKMNYLFKMSKKDGTIHLLYSIRTERIDEMWYAENSSGEFISEFLTSNEHMSYHYALAIDDSGVPHILYREWEEGLYYATKSGSTWKTELIDPSYQRFEDIKVDRNRTIHVVFGPFETGLKYGTNSGGTWHFETVPFDQYEINGAKLALDSADEPHISFRLTDPIYYCTKPLTDWQCDRIENDGGHHTLALDQDDFAHIVTSDIYEIKHLTNRSGQWVTNIIDYNGRDPSMVLDSMGQVHITYESNNALMYVRLPEGF